MTLRYKSASVYQQTHQNLEKRLLQIVCSFYYYKLGKVLLQIETFFAFTNRGMSITNLDSRGVATNCGLGGPGSNRDLFLYYKYERGKKESSFSSSY